jgi:hypothetical protein
MYCFLKDALHEEVSDEKESREEGHRGRAHRVVVFAGASVGGGVTAQGGSDNIVWVRNKSGHDGRSDVVGFESLVNGNNMVSNTISIDISNASRNDDSAISADADSISSDEVGQVNDPNGGVSNGNRLESQGGNSDRREDFAVGLVVLSDFSHVSGNQDTIGNSVGLIVGILRGEDVSSNSGRSGYGSSRSENVVDNSFDNGWERLSLNGYILGSGNVDNPSGVELASNNVEPSDLIPGGSIDLNMVEVRDSVASYLKTVSVDNGGLSVVGNFRKKVGDGSVVSLGSVESRGNIGGRLVVQQSVKQVGGGIEVSANVSVGSQTSSVDISDSVGVERSRRPRGITSNEEGEGSPSINGDGQFLSEGETIEGGSISGSKSSLNISTIASERIERNYVEVNPSSGSIEVGERWGSVTVGGISSAAVLQGNIAHSKEFSTSSSSWFEAISGASGRSSSA